MSEPPEAAAKQEADRTSQLEALGAALRDYEARADPEDPAAAALLERMRELTGSLQRPLWSRATFRRTTNAPPPKSAFKPDESLTLYKQHVAADAARQAGTQQPALALTAGTGVAARAGVGGGQQ